MGAIKLLRQVAADLAASKAPSAVQDAVRIVLRHYLAEAQRSGSLGGPQLELRDAGTPKRRKRRLGPFKQAKTRNALLRLLGRAQRPLTAPEIRGRLARGGLEMTRQAVNYHLARLKRLGQVEKVKEGRPRWWTVRQANGAASKSGG